MNYFVECDGKQLRFKMLLWKIEMYKYNPTQTNLLLEVPTCQENYFDLFKYK